MSVITHQTGPHSISLDPAGINRERGHCHIKFGRTALCWGWKMEGAEIQIVLADHELLNSRMSSKKHPTQKDEPCDDHSCIAHGFEPGRRGSCGCMPKGRSSARNKVCSSPFRRRPLADSATGGGRLPPARGSASSGCGSGSSTAGAQVSWWWIMSGSRSAAVPAPGSRVHPAHRPGHRVAVHPRAVGEGAKAPRRRWRGEDPHASSSGAETVGKLGL